MKSTIVFIITFNIFGLIFLLLHMNNYHTKYLVVFYQHVHILKFKYRIFHRYKLYTHIKTRKHIQKNPNQWIYFSICHLCFKMYCNCENWLKLN